MEASHRTFHLSDGQASEGGETCTLVQSPNATPVTVKVTFLPAGGGTTIVKTETIPASSRRTFNKAEHSGQQHRGVEGDRHEADYHPKYSLKPGRFPLNNRKPLKGDPRSRDLGGDIGVEGDKIAMLCGGNERCQFKMSGRLTASWKGFDVEMQYEVGTGVLRSDERNNTNVIYFYHDDTWDNLCWTVSVEESGSVNPGEIVVAIPGGVDPLAMEKNMTGLPANS